MQCQFPAVPCWAGREVRPTVNPNPASTDPASTDPASTDPADGQAGGWPRWAAAVRDALARKSLSVNAAAEHLGVRNTTLRRWLDGAAPPQLSLLPRIAELTGLDLRRAGEARRGLLAAAGYRRRPLPRLDPRGQRLRPAGMAGDQAAPGTVELISMFVRPQARGRGVGEALIDVVIGWARSGTRPRAPVGDRDQQACPPALRALRVLADRRAPAAAVQPGPRRGRHDPPAGPGDIAVTTEACGKHCR